MHTKHLLVLLFFFAKFHNYSGCSSSGDKNKFTSPELYDLNTPYKMELPSGLNEISGISYYPKDSSVFAEIDEDGILFKIFLNQNKKILQWRFDKKHDFEDIVMHDSLFYLLISNGDIETVKFEKDSILTDKLKFPDADKKTNEFETLYWDDDYKKLVMLCKDCEDDKKKIVSAWGIDSSTYSSSLYSIDVKPVAQKIGEDKLHLKPSAAAINPLTNELYILCSVNKLLVVTDRKGNFKNVYQLDPEIYKQPEGITFTPWGDLLISNEAGEEGSADILIFKPKKKG